MSDEKAMERQAPAEELVEFLCSTIAMACGRDVSDVSPDTLLSGLNMDSLTFVSVLSQVEAVYEVEFPVDEILELLTAESVATLSGRVSEFLRRSGFPTSP